MEKITLYLVAKGVEYRKASVTMSAKGFDEVRLSVTVQKALTLADLPMTNAIGLRNCHHGTTAEVLWLWKQLSIHKEGGGIGSLDKQNSLN